MFHIGDIVDERYEVEALVGQGGLAEVYRVRHVDLGSVHALKVLLWRRKSLIERLVLEGRIQAQLRHPHIVTVTDLVRMDGQVGLLMEYIDHETLESYIERRGALGIDDALNLMIPVMSAVIAAHDAGVLHRDLKPANIMLSATSRGVVPKVADFGIAKVVADDMERSGGTAAGVTMGTPGYLAPEQVLDSADSDARVDVFALGAILYECISGRRAFADERGNVDVRSTIENAPRSLAADELCTPAVCDAVAKSLAKHRDERFPDVRTFARALLVDHPALLAQIEDRQDAVPLSLELRRDTIDGGPRTSSATRSSVTRSGRGTTIGGRAGATDVLTGSPSIAGAAIDSGAGQTQAELPPGGTILPFDDALGNEQLAGESGNARGAITLMPASNTVPPPEGSRALWAAIAAVGLVATLALVAVLAVGLGYVSAPRAPEPVADRATSGVIVVEPADVAPAGTGAQPDPGSDAVADGQPTNPVSVAVAGPQPKEPASVSAASGGVGASDSAPTNAGMADAGTGDADPAAAAPVNPAPASVNSAPASVNPAPAPVDGPAVVNDDAVVVNDTAATGPSNVEGRSDVPVPPNPGGTAAEAPPPTRSGLEGTWTGKADGRSFQLRFTGMDGADILGEATFYIGPSQRTSPVRGAYDPATGALRVRESSGEFEYSGTVSGSTLAGTYSKGGNKQFAFQVERR